MAKKKTLKAGLKKIIDEYKDKVLLVMASFLEKEATQLVEWFKDITKIKRRVRMLVIITGLVFAGLFLVTLGIAKYVVYKIPALANGWGEILVGIIVVIVAYLIKQLS